MAVAFDAVGPSSAGAGSTSSSTLSWTHTNVASGVDVLVGVAFDGTDTGITVTCTVGGTSATSLGKVEAGAGGTGFLQVFRRTGVGSGAQTVTCTASSPANDMTGGSISFTGVTGIGTPVTLQNSSTNPSLNVTGVAATSMVAGFYGSGNTIGSPSGGGTNRFTNNLEGGAGSATGNCAGSTNTGTGTVAIGWTSTSTSNALLGVELQGAGGGDAPELAEIPWQYRPFAVPWEPFSPWPPWDTGSPPPAAVQAGPPVYPLQGPVRARLPQSFLKGRVTGSSDGVFGTSGPPVTPLHGPVRTRPQPPPRGRSQARYGTFTAAAPQAGPPLYPLRGPVQARLPLQPLRPGRTATMVALPLFYAGPPLTPLQRPVQARQPLPKRGRAQGSPGAPVSAAPPQGAPAPPLHAPVRTRPQPPRRGRAASNPGTRQQTGPPVTPLRGPVCARQPLPRRGRCAGSQGTFTQVAITSGPPVYPLRGPVRTRPQPPPRGRCAGNRGIRHQGGPTVTPLRGPVAPFRPGPYRSGRCASLDGTYAQLGPQFYPLRKPARARIPHRPRGGRTAGNIGAPVFVPPFTIGALTAVSAVTGTLGAGSAATGTLTASTAPLGTSTAADV